MCLQASEALAAAGAASVRSLVLLDKRERRGRRACEVDYAGFSVRARGRGGRGGTRTQHLNFSRSHLQQGSLVLIGSAAQMARHPNMID
jgi:hypothetical protein